MIHLLLPALVLLWIIAYMIVVYVKADDDKQLYERFQEQLTPMSIVFAGLAIYASACHCMKGMDNERRIDDFRDPSSSNVMGSSTSV